MPSTFISLAVVGSRDVNDTQRIYAHLDRCLDNASEKGHGLIIVSGGARGVDRIAAAFAKERMLPLIEIIPEWDRLGKQAGFIRNKLIWEKADCGIAFWNGTSPGTKHSFDLAKEQGKKLVVVHVSDLPW